MHKRLSFGQHWLTNNDIIIYIGEVKPNDTEYPYKCYNLNGYFEYSVTHTGVRWKDSKSEYDLKKYITPENNPEYFL